MLSMKNTLRFTPSSTWTRAASMCASLSSTPTPSNSLFFVDSNASKSIILDYFSAAKNYFIKYGELGVMNCAAERVIIKLVDKLKDLKNSCFQALMKQKHRLMWERRHGEVGSGMKTEAGAAAAE